MVVLKLIDAGIWDTVVLSSSDDDQVDSKVSWFGGVEYSQGKEVVVWEKRRMRRRQRRSREEWLVLEEEEEEEEVVPLVERRTCRGVASTLAASGAAPPVQEEAAPESPTRVEVSTSSEEEETMKTPRNTVTRKELADAQKLFYIPKEVTFKVLDKDEQMHRRCRPGEVALHLDALRGGLRIPVHGLITEILAHYGIMPSQLTLNSFQNIVGFCIYFADHD